MSRAMRKGFLCHMRTTKAQINSVFSLMQAVSQEEPSDKKPDPWLL